MADQNRLGRRLQIRALTKNNGFHTLFSKLVFIYFSILVFILIVVFVVFNHIFQSFFIQFTEEIMINQAKNIVAEYERVGRYSTSSGEAISSIRKRVEIMNEYLQATTWIIDDNGSGYEFKLGEEMTRLYEPGVSKRMADSVFEGETVCYENDFKSDFAYPVLTVAHPITLHDKVQYALLIHTPITYVSHTLQDAQAMIARLIGAAAVIVFIWIYFVSKQMTKPLKEMNDVAKVIAGGRFGERITVRGRDEIAQLGHSLNHMAAELERIEENRSEFIANISHDLRSPLTSISGFVTAILDGTISQQDQERYLKIVLSETQRLITMSNGILDLTRMQETLPIGKNVFNINLMIKRILLGFESRCKEKGIHLYTDLNQEKVYVYAQQDGISRVLHNLMENACKFVNKPGDILIRTQVIGHKLWVSVLNSGPPIPKAQQEMIWERFYKGDSSRGQDKTGVGLGLVIVKEIIKQNQEEVGVESKEGQMVRFYFSLTLAAPKENEQHL